MFLTFYSSLKIVLKAGLFVPDLLCARRVVELLIACSFSSHNPEYPTDEEMRQGERLSNQPSVTQLENGHITV